MTPLTIRITPHEVTGNGGASNFAVCSRYSTPYIGSAVDAIMEGLSEFAYREPAELLEAMTDPHTAPFDLLTVCRDALRILSLKSDEDVVVESDEEFAHRMRRTGKQGGEVRKWAGNFLIPGDQHAVCDASEVGG
jgi:hypothetical protein